MFLEWFSVLFEVLQCFGLPIQEINSWPFGPIEEQVMLVLDMMDLQFLQASPIMGYVTFVIFFFIIMAALIVFISLMFVFMRGNK
jgi:hypothetical protein